MTTPTVPTTTDPRQNFDLILAREPFKGLKAILEQLTRDGDAIHAAVITTKTFEELVAKLGYRMNLTKQIHVQDAFSRMGPAGGIRAVLPYHDIPTQSSFPTLVNYDSTVTTTPGGAAFFNELLTVFKNQSRT